MFAADGMATSDGVVTSSHCQKLHRLHDGRLAALMGSAIEAQTILKWIEGGETGKQPNVGGHDGAVVIADENGLALYESGFIERYGPSEYRAFGCGWRIAMGAMAVGATAEEAVRAACELDVYCGGEVTVLQLKRDAKPAIRAA
jgi:ATP-dependent protease HslVU (ClpYQ) peptidase subunit